MKTINKSIEISAPREKVWHVLFDDEMYRKWAAIFSPQSRADTDWKQGSRAAFVDDSNSGMLGTIAENREPEFLSISYDGFLVGGKEDLESPGAKEFRGSLETYTLTEVNGGTRLDVTSGMSDEYYDTMNASWDDAMLKIKELAEQS